MSVDILKYIINKTNSFSFYLNNSIYNALLYQDVASFPLKDRLVLQISIIFIDEYLSKVLLVKEADLVRL